MNETKYLEYKKEVTTTFLKTVCAFSNYEGGTIVFGIDDNGKVIGLDDLGSTSLQIENMINDNIDPNPTYFININSRKKTIELKVEPGDNKPYLYKNKAYKRNNTATIEVDKFELRRLVLEGSDTSYDSLDVSRDDLSFNVLEGKLKEKLKIEKLDKDILKTLRLYVDGKYNKAAELFADMNNFCGIDCVRFGESINIFKERKIIENVSIIKQYDEALDFYKRYYKYEEIIGSYREEKESIPEAAFREALINAIAHRTYDIEACIRVAMWYDKIEIYSVGGLPSQISEDDYLNGHISYLRNPIIGDILNRLGYIERFGTGVKKIKEAYKNSFSKPRFEFADNAIKITLPLFDDINLNKDERYVYDLTSPVNMVSSGDIADLTGFSKSKTKEILKKLVDENYLEIEGNGRGTKYKRG